MTLATTHHISGVEQSSADAAHIALWQPAVALAVAAWLENTADACERTTLYVRGVNAVDALAVADALLAMEKASH